MKLPRALVCLAAAGFAWTGSSATGAIVENDALRITFETREAGYAISSIENKLAGNARFVRPSSSVSNFWEIVLTSRDATGGVRRVALDNRSPAAETKVERVGDETRFIWKGLDIPGGIVVEKADGVVFTGTGVDESN